MFRAWQAAAALLGASSQASRTTAQTTNKSEPRIDSQHIAGANPGPAQIARANGHVSLVREASVYPMSTTIGYPENVNRGPAFDCGSYCFTGSPGAGIRRREA